MMRGMVHPLVRGISRSGVNPVAEQSLLGEAILQLGDIEPDHYWDFTTNRALFAGADVGAVTDTPNWSFSRASSGYAETEAGVLQSFASGEIRRTDKGLLIEGAATNLLTYSQQIAGGTGSWLIAGLNSALNQNAAVAPDGTTTAARLIDDAATGTGVVGVAYNSPAISTSTAYTFSVYAKADQLSWIHLSLIAFTTPANGGVYFNLSGAGTVGTASTGLTGSIKALANGWYRCSITYTSDASDTTGQLRIYTAQDGTSLTVDRDGTSSVFIWGAQLE